MSDTDTFAPHMAKVATKLFGSAGKSFNDGATLRWGTHGSFKWDRNLTDEDGPYIELMCGVFTDNQPDFAWIQPNEEKSFEQYFMPYAEIGLVKNASKEAALNVDFNGNEILLKVYATAVYPNAVIQIFENAVLLNEFTTDLSPRKPTYGFVES